MSIIKTKRNLVSAYEPQTGDVAVLLRFGAMRVLEAISDSRRQLPWPVDDNYLGRSVT